MLKPRLRIVYKLYYGFRPDLSQFPSEYGSPYGLDEQLWSVRGEWRGREVYYIERKLGLFGKWERAGVNHWYSRDSFGTYEEAKDALKYFDGTVQEYAVVWESN